MVVSPLVPLSLFLFRIATFSFRFSERRATAADRRQAANSETRNRFRCCVAVETKSIFDVFVLMSSGEEKKGTLKCAQTLRAKQRSAREMKSIFNLVLKSESVSCFFFLLDSNENYFGARERSASKLPKQSAEHSETSRRSG